MNPHEEKLFEDYLAKEGMPNLFKGKTNMLFEWCSTDAKQFPLYDCIELNDVVDQLEPIVAKCQAGKMQKDFLRKELEGTLFYEIFRDKSESRFRRCYTQEERNPGRVLSAIYSIIQDSHWLYDVKSRVNEAFAQYRKVNDFEKKDRGKLDKLIGEVDYIKKLLVGHHDLLKTFLEEYGSKLDSAPAGSN